MADTWARYCVLPGNIGDLFRSKKILTALVGHPAFSLRCVICGLSEAAMVRSIASRRSTRSGLYSVIMYGNSELMNSLRYVKRYERIRERHEPLSVSVDFLISVAGRSSNTSYTDSYRRRPKRLPCFASEQEIPCSSTAGSQAVQHLRQQLVGNKPTICDAE